MGSKWIVVWLLAGAVACAGTPVETLTTDVVADPASAAGPTVAWEEAADVLERRCVVCHGCYDAPCQLKLSSFEGLRRGGSPDKIYNSMRLVKMEPSRLFIDATNTAAWRARNFHPVVSEKPGSKATDGIMHRLLDLKRKNPLPPRPVLGKEFDFALDRDQQCVKQEEFDTFAKEHPNWGMPYGLPGVSDREHATLTGWIKQGAAAPAPVVPVPGLTEQVRRWEKFLNGDSLKHQLTARYIFEHLFLAHVYFSDVSSEVYFRLLRSRTPPGEPIQEIKTRRPFGDPGKGRVYYRLTRLRSTILTKTHMPYELNDERLERWNEYFIEPEYEVKSLPSYKGRVSANPFLAFKQLPVRARYRLMLEEAQYTIMGFIKGPVCRGQVALDVIHDHFWIVFDDPDSLVIEEGDDWMKEQADLLDMPAEAGSSSGLSRWLKYSHEEEQFLEAKAKFFNKVSGDRITLDLLWDGDGNNTNAALTVFRHYDSATVTKGLVGTPPDTTWYLGYMLLERIHYLLVAGFDVYGNAGHQLNTRLYMDFLRMEAEGNYLALMMPEARMPLIDFWYRDTSSKLKKHLKKHIYHHRPGIEYTSLDPQAELYTKLIAKLSPVLDRSYDLQPSDELHAQLLSLERTVGPKFHILPEVSFLSVERTDGELEHFTLLHNVAHKNVAHLFGEESRLAPEEDTVTVARGFVGAYPNAFLVLKEADVPALVSAIKSLETDDDYELLLNKHGLRRTDKRFWKHSDLIHEEAKRERPIEAGLFDYNRFEDR